MAGNPLMGADEKSTIADLSVTMNRYLTQVYRLSSQQPDNQYISTSALADVLDVSAPAVNRMVSRLREGGLLEHEPYHGIRLTPAGQREALKALRRHRIAEVFLVEVMGFGWHQVHEEATRIAQGMSAAITGRMNQMTGFPTHCPHGEPIPTEDGDLPPLDDSFLVDAEMNANLVVTRVRTRESDRLEYLAALGLVPGTSIQVLHKAPFNGPLQLRVGKEYRIVGHNLAELIRVKSA
jgi:DtxR family transcriptional regulator, Mn-dependent transcriptional regulator